MAVYYDGLLLQQPKGDVSMGDEAKGWLVFIVSATVVVVTLILGTNHYSSKNLKIKADAAVRVIEQGVHPLDARCLLTHVTTDPVCVLRAE